MKLIILITAQTEKGLDVATAWQAAGAPGVTLLRAQGFYSLQEQINQGEVELPLITVSMARAMAAMLDHMETDTLLFLSLVDDGQVEALIDASSQILGDLTEPGNGILFVLPIERALGMVRRERG